MNAGRLALAFACVVACACCTTMADNEIPIPMPTIDQSAPLRFPYFGSDRTAELLGDILLKSDDAGERAQAAVDLGQTNNMNAVKLLDKAFADKDPQVRQAVVTAAAALIVQTPEYMRQNSPEFKQAAKIIQQAFGDLSQSVKLAAISAAGSSKVQIGDVIGLAEGNDQVLAIQALNVVNQSSEHLRIPDSYLLKAIESNTLPLQLAAIANIVKNDESSLRTIPAEYGTAIMNIVNGKKTPSPLVTALKKLSISGNDALAAGAIEALTSLDASSAKPFIEKAAKNHSPLLRRAAVASFAVYREWNVEKWKAQKNSTTKPASRNVSALESIDMFSRIPAFLDDPSPLVKLAAVRAAGIARKNNALINQTQKLIDVAFAAPDTQLHDAAITASMNQSGALPLAVDEYKKMMPEYLAEKNAKGTLLERNLSSVCKIIASCKSDAVLNEMLADIQKLSLDSILVGDIADALGAAGSKSAIPTLEKMLKTCQATGAKFLIAMASMSTPPAFDEKNAAKIVSALASLDAKRAVPAIISISQLNAMGMRLNVVNAAVPPALVKLCDNSNRSEIGKQLSAMITDTSYDKGVIFNAIIACGELKISDSLSGLKQVLDEERPSKITIWAAAWATGQISGKYPAQPQPEPNEGNWIIKSLK